LKEIRDLIEKAEKFLGTAEQALNTGDYDSSVSRCYYAMFFMAEAVLLTKNITGYSHKGVISKFGEHFVKTKILGRNLGKSLNDAYDKRLVGDYGVGFTVTEQQAKDLLKTAQDFVLKLKSYLKKQIETE
jgi:uncharacterized protein (UPF0332 family)